MRPFLLVLLSLALAGCAASPVDTANGNAPAANGTSLPGMTPIVKTFDVSLAVATPSAAGQEPTATEKAAVEVPAGYTRMVADAKLTCASPACDFRLGLFSASQKSEDWVPSPSNWTVKAGAFEVALHSAGPAANMAGKITVTLT